MALKEIGRIKRVIKAKTGKVLRRTPRIGSESGRSRNRGPAGDQTRSRWLTHQSLDSLFLEDRQCKKTQEAPKKSKDHDDVPVANVIQV